MPKAAVAPLVGLAFGACFALALTIVLVSMFGLTQPARSYQPSMAVTAAQ
jgi:hypothetical protein